MSSVVRTGSSASRVKVVGAFRSMANTSSAVNGTWMFPTASEEPTAVTVIAGISSASSNKV